MSCREQFEAFEVFRNMPGEFSTFADGAVSAECGNNDELHTITFNLSSWNPESADKGNSLLVLKIASQHGLPTILEC